jgi:hypothetical protein
MYVSDNTIYDDFGSGAFFTAIAQSAIITNINYIDDGGNYTDNYRVINFTKEGNLDWRVWGTLPNTTYNTDRKLGGTAIGDVSLVGHNWRYSSGWATEHFDGAWTDGTVKPTATSDHIGILNFDHNNVGDDYAMFDTIVGDTSGVLRVYVGRYYEAGKLTATISGGSSKELVLSPVSGVNYGWFEIAYQGSPGAVLTTKWQSTTGGTIDDIKLYGATLGTNIINIPISITNFFSAFWSGKYKLSSCTECHRWRTTLQLVLQW